MRTSDKSKSSIPRWTTTRHAQDQAVKATRDVFTHGSPFREWSLVLFGQRKFGRKTWNPDFRSDSALPNWTKVFETEYSDDSRIMRTSGVGTTCLRPVALVYFHHHVTALYLKNILRHTQPRTGLVCCAARESVGNLLGKGPSQVGRSQNPNKIRPKRTKAVPHRTERHF